MTNRMILLFATTAVLPWVWGWITHRALARWWPMTAAPAESGEPESPGGVAAPARQPEVSPFDYQI